MSHGNIRKKDVCRVPVVFRREFASKCLNSVTVLVRFLIDSNRSVVKNVTKRIRSNHFTKTQLEFQKAPSHWKRWKLLAQVRQPRPQCHMRERLSSACAKCIKLLRQCIKLLFCLDAFGLYVVFWFIVFGDVTCECRIHDTALGFAETIMERKIQIRNEWIDIYRYGFKSEISGLDMSKKVHNFERPTWIDSEEPGATLQFGPRGPKRQKQHLAISCISWPFPHSCILPCFYQ